MMEVFLILNFLAMDFQFSEKSLKLQKELSDFMLEYVNDQEQSILNFQKNNIWINDPKIEDLKN